MARQFLARRAADDECGPGSGERAEHERALGVDDVLAGTGLAALDARRTLRPGDCTNTPEALCRQCRGPPTAGQYSTILRFGGLFDSLPAFPLSFERHPAENLYGWPIQRALQIAICFGRWTTRARFLALLDGVTQIRPPTLAPRRETQAGRRFTLLGPPLPEKNWQRDTADDVAGWCTMRRVGPKDI